VYSTGIGYRVDPNTPNAHIPIDVSNLEQVIPNMDVPYDILWDTTYKSYVHILDDYRESIAMCLLRRGHTDVNTSDKALLAQAQKDLIDGQAAMDWKADANAYVDVPEAQALIHHDWSGAFAFVPFYYPNWSPRDVIRYWWPANHKGVIGGDHLTLLAGGKNPVLGHQFINFMLDFDVAMTNYVWNGFQPPMKQVTTPEQLTKGSPDGIKPYNVLPPSLGSIVVSPDQFDQGFQILELTPQVDEQWKSVWEAFQTS
jgi:spermidine/putrescine transport system substrate-binding protein